MSDPNQPGTLSVTLKADEPGGKYNDAKSPGTWIVFHGTPETVRECILTTFGWTDEESLNQLVLSDLVAEATKAYKGQSNATTILGARPVNEKSGDAWAAARGETPAPKEEEKPKTLAELIEETTSVDALRELWLERSADIKAESLVEAWTEKGKALKAVA